MELTAVKDTDPLAGLSSHGAALLHLPHDVQPRHDGAKHDVLPVQPAGLLRADEELGAVGVRAGVCHGDHSGSRVAELEVLVLKVLPVHGLPPGPVPGRDVPALHHELRDDAVEDGAFQSEASLPGAETSEVL